MTKHMNRTFGLGRAGEEDTRKVLNKRGCEIVWSAPNIRFPYYDVIIRNKNPYAKSRFVKIEVKNDMVNSGNIAIEFLQETNGDGILIASGIKKTQADYYAIVKRGHGKIYFIAVEELKRRINARQYSIAACNANSESGKTMCYLMSIDDIERDKAFYSTEDIIQ